MTDTSGTSAVVLAAGLGTRMRSGTPKVLHPLCGRPMLAYVLDAWASTQDGAAGGRPIVVFSPAVAALIDVFADRAVFALQDEPRGTGDAVGAALAIVPDEATEILVLSGDVPLVTGSDLDAILEARREDDAAIALASVFAADPAELGRVVRSEFGTVERIVEARDAEPEELAGQRDQRRPVRVRRRVAAPPDRGPHAVRRDRGAVPDRSRPARPRGRPHRDRGRLRGRRPLRRHQRPIAAGRGRMEHACPAQRGAHARRRDDARPVHGLPRLDGRARPRRHARTERHPARRDERRCRQRHRRRQPADRFDGRGERRRLGQHRRVVDDRGRRDGRAVQPRAAGERHRARRHGRQLRRAQEHASGPRLEAASHELPRRCPDRRRASTSAPGPSPRTSTARTRTQRRSATAPSSASTRCSSPRSRWVRGRAPARVPW